MPETCADHKALIERLDSVSSGLEQYTESNDRVITRLERVAVEIGKAAVRFEHIEAALKEAKEGVREATKTAKEDVEKAKADIEKANAAQWTKINDLQKYVHIGLGAALTLSLAASVVAAVGVFIK